MAKTRSERGLETPVAHRLTRPSWRDPQLLVGLLLVLGSVIAGAKVVSAADDTVPMYAAARELVPGVPLGSDDLRPVDVSLGQNSDRYVAVAGGLPTDRVLTRAVRPGELVPADALAPVQQSGMRPIMVPTAPDGASVLVSGSVVDVWVNAKVKGGAGAGDEYGTPQRMLTGVSVASTDSGAGGLGAARSTVGVQIMVPADSVEKVIGAIDQGSKVTLVPAYGSPLAGR